MSKRIVMLIGCFAVLAGAVVVAELAPRPSVIVVDDAKDYVPGAMAITAPAAVIVEPAIALEHDIGPAGSENCYNDAGLLAFENLQQVPDSFRKEDPGNLWDTETGSNQTSVANRIHGPPIVPV